MHAHKKVSSSSRLGELRIQYRDLTGYTAPRNLRAPLLQKLINWHVRCIEKGVPLREAFFYRAELIKDFKLDGLTSRDGVENGSVLIREHNGRSHTVRKGQDGRFHYSGRSYKSLTAVAFAITGVHQSGPRFFKVKTRHRAAR